MIDSLPPQARQDGLIIQELADETLVYDQQRHKAHCLNRTAALVWAYCDGQTTVAELATRLTTELGEPVDAEVVWLALDRLSKAHLLMERVASPVPADRLSRREFVRKVGLGAAVALPVVASLVAPTVAQAATLVSRTDCINRVRTGNCGGTPCVGGGTCRRVVPGSLRCGCI